MDTASRPNVMVGDTVRPMTDEEFVQWQADCADARRRREELAAQVAADEQARRSARSKLVALGLTEDEIAALQRGL